MSNANENFVSGRYMEWWKNKKKKAKNYIIYTI